MVGGDLAGVRVVGVAAGGNHSIALAADGRVFTFGRGECGVLGHGDEQDQRYPRVVEEHLTMNYHCKPSLQAP